MNVSQHLAAIAELTKAKPAPKKKCGPDSGTLHAAQEQQEYAEGGDEEGQDSAGPPTFKCGCGKALKSGQTCSKCQKTAKASASLYVPIAKANDEEQTVTGVVLQPEVTDGQGDIYDASVIKDAAYGYLMNYNKSTELGLQHKEFVKGRFALVESYLTPLDIAIGNNVVKQGSWVMTVKVLDPKIWKLVKDGKITGFSIGGKARVQQLKK